MRIKRIKGVDEYPKTGQRHQSNYTLADSSIASMVDFATNQTLFNEVVHEAVCTMMLPGLVENIATIASGTANTGTLGGTAFNLAVFGINAGLSLAQRYTRAKLNLTIDKSLQHGRPFDTDRYPNRLGLKLPQNTPTNSSINS